MLYNYLEYKNTQFKIFLNCKWNVYLNKIFCIIQNKYVILIKNIKKLGVFDGFLINKDVIKNLIKI